MAAMLQLMDVGQYGERAMPHEATMCLDQQGGSGDEHTACICFLLLKE